MGWEGNTYFFGLLHVVLALLVVAFFVLFAASKASGFIKIFGSVLGYLLLVLAVLAIVARFAMPFEGGRMCGTSGMTHQHPWIMGHGWCHEQTAPLPTPVTKK
jgi:vacuolar-type H+-ATPase subunit I/STV1